MCDGFNGKYMTNYEIIKQMSVEEMVNAFENPFHKFCDSVETCKGCPLAEHLNLCIDNEMSLKDWLERET